MGKETESEKLVKDTLIKKQADNSIYWFHKFRQLYSTAPLDFVLINNSKEINFIEVKEVKGATMAWGQFKDGEQRKLLHGLPNTWLILRFSADMNRNNTNYWENYFLCVSSHWCPKPGQKGGSIALEDLLNCKDNTVYRLAYVDYTGSHGFGDEAGLTTQENPSRGLLDIGRLEN